MEQNGIEDHNLVNDLHGTGVGSIGYLRERFIYLLWMLNRDEISTQTADQWMDNFISRAKEIHRLEILEAFEEGMFHHVNGYTPKEYYKETFNTKEK